MAPKLSEDEIDDLIYFARAGELADLNETLSSLASREGVSPAEILTAAKDEGKSTCLHMATGNGHLEIVQTLITHFTTRPKSETQAYLDAPNEFGNTGLHWAALGGHLEVVKFLVAEGASPALANDKEYIPLDLAGLGEKTEVVNFFLADLKKLEAENATKADGGGLGEAAAAMDLDDKGGEDMEGVEGLDGPEEEDGKRKEKSSS